MHYAEDDIEYTKTAMKTPRLQALPTMNLPLKSHKDTKVERKEVSVYKDLDELHKSAEV